MEEKMTTGYYRTTNPQTTATVTDANGVLAKIEHLQELASRLHNSAAGLQDRLGPILRSYPVAAGPGSDNPACSTPLLGNLADLEHTLRNVESILDVTHQNLAL